MQQAKKMTIFSKMKRLEQGKPVQVSKKEELLMWAIHLGAGLTIAPLLYIFMVFMLSL